MKRDDLKIFKKEESLKIGLSNGLVLIGNIHEYLDNCIVFVDRDESIHCIPYEEITVASIRREKSNWNNKTNFNNKLNNIGNRLNNIGDEINKSIGLGR